MDKLKMKEIRKQVRSAEIKNEERFENQQDYYNRISQAKDTLTEAGYYVGNLYQVEDVQVYFDCTDDEAFDVLDGALDNEGTAEQVWTAIREVGDMMGLKEIED